MDENFLNGLFPALLTPFKENEALDENGLKLLVERLVNQGADGLYVCGSSGEVMLLSLEERKRILEIVTGMVGDRLTVVAHIGCQRTADTLELALHAQRQGARAISALPPIYYKYTIQEVSAYYRELMDAVKLPFIVYNAPVFTGMSFDQSNIAEIFAHPNACGMKFTSYDSYSMQRLLSQYPQKTMINGHDETYLPSLALGVECAIGSTLNFTLGNFRHITERFQAGDMKTARNGQDKINGIMDILLEVGIFRGLKGVMALLGLSLGNCRRPIMPITNQEQKKLERILPLIVGA